jgi:iron complex outermembrane receptor protein
LANTSWRTGLVFELTPSLSVYGQYTTGTDGVDSLVTLSASDAAFKLSTGRQWEAGIKQDLMNGRGFWTLAVYGIVKNNLLTTDPLNPTVTEQVGQQSSRGIELSGAFQIGAGWAIEANAALLRARFDDFDEASGDTTVSRAGNVPNGIPEQSANLWLSWAWSSAWKIGSGLRYVGRTYGDNANTVPVPSYTVIDASAQWQVTHSTSLALYLRNLANRAYALSTTNDGNQWLLGPSRSAELVATTTF